VHKAQRILELSLERNEHHRQVFFQKNIKNAENFALKIKVLENYQKMKEKELQIESDLKVDDAYRAYQVKLQNLEYLQHQKSKNIKGYAEGQLIRNVSLKKLWLQS